MSNRISEQPFCQTRVMRSSFVGKKFIAGDTFKIKNFDYLRDAPFVYKDISEDTFMSVTGTFHWKSQVEEIQTNSLWSRIVWLFQ
jgi:hypothetical protein